MGDAFDPQPQGGFASFLDWLDKPGQVVRNTLKGNFKGAAKNFGDFLLDPVDAILPGDMIPELAGPEDKVSGADLVNIDKKEHPFLGFLGDVGVGTLTDPLTYAGGPLLKGAAKAVGAGVSAAEKIPQVASAIDKGSSLVRRTFGAQRLSPEVRAIVDKARAAATNEKRAGLDQARNALAGLNDNELNIVGDVIDNFKWKDGKLVGKLAENDMPAADRVLMHPEVNAENADRIKRAVNETIRLGQEQKARPNIFRDNGLSDEYLMRSYSGIDPESAIDMATRTPSPAKGRTLNSLEDVQGFLNEKPGVTYERNALKRSAQRAEAQGMLAQRAEIGKGLVGDAFAYTDDVTKKAALEKIAELAPDEQQVLKDMYTGMAPRGTFQKMLAGSNGLFKKYAVYGAVIPKFGSVVRNKISGIWQAAANPETRAVVGGQVKRLGSDLADATTESLGLKNLSTGELSQSLDQIDAAFKASGGSAEKAMAVLSPDLADAVRYGVAEGYVSAEDLLREMGATGWKKNLNNIVNWPGKIFGGVESRMRLGAFLDLKKAGSTSEDAARAVKDAFYDYAVSSKENRLARDAIPFFQFQAKAIPQTAKLIAEKPAVGVALSQALGSPQGPLYPWMEGKSLVPLGQDEQGNDQYATGLGLPFESLNLIPTSARDIEKNVVGSANPLLKTAFSAVAGVDPYFETPYGSYDKIPGIGEAGDAGRLYNEIAQTGMIQPIDSLLHMIGSATDPRHSAAIKALDLLTGVNVASVDPDLALQKQLQDLLAHSPDIKQHRSFYETNQDPEAQKLIEQYNQAKAKVKAKRRE